MGDSLNILTSELAQFPTSSNFDRSHGFGYTSGPFNEVLSARYVPPLYQPSTQTPRPVLCCPGEASQIPFRPVSDLPKNKPLQGLFRVTCSKQATCRGCKQDAETPEVIESNSLTVVASPCSAQEPRATCGKPGCVTPLRRK